MSPAVPGHPLTPKKGDEPPKIDVARAEPKEQFQDALDAFVPDDPEAIDWDNDPLDEPSHGAEHSKWSHSFSA